MTEVRGQRTENEQAKRKKLEIEQDGEFVGAGTVGVFSVADIGKLGKPAKTIRFASAGCYKLIGKPETLGGQIRGPGGKSDFPRVQIETS